MYRNAVKQDIYEIVNIHLGSFQGFFMSLLGPKFLKLYYHKVLEYPDRIFLVKESEGRVVGFVSGFLNPALFYNQIRHERLKWMLMILPHVLSHPRLIPRLIASYAQAGRSSQQEDPDVCELSSIAVPPSLGGRGIGKGLVHAFIEATRGKARSVVLTTDADGNDNVNGFYRSLGFAYEGSYERSKGRRMNIYRIRLDA